LAYGKVPALHEVFARGTRVSRNRTPRPCESTTHMGQGFSPENRITHVGQGFSPAL
jgi:hypothetical protein